MKNITMNNPEILYEDRHILCVHKAAGMAVQNASTGQMDLECMLKNYLARKAAGAVSELYVVHRLDQPVEGILVFAKTKKAAAGLQKQITEQKMQKQYLAVVEQKVTTKEETLLEDYLKKDRQMAVVVDKSAPQARQAVLLYTSLDTKEGKSLLKVQLKTGRFHQIRCQLSHAGMPIAGDTKYGGHKQPGERGIALCAYSLSFAHPVTGERMHFVHEPVGAAFTVFKEKVAELCAQ